MSKKTNIEELAKHKLSNYAPDVPSGVWEGLQVKMLAKTAVSSATVGSGLSFVPGLVAGVIVTLATLAGVQVAEDVRKNKSQITVRKNTELKKQERFTKLQDNSEPTVEASTAEAEKSAAKANPLASEPIRMPQSNVRIAQDDLSFEEFALEVEASANGNVETGSAEPGEETAQVQEIAQAGIDAGPIAGDVPLTVSFQTKEVTRAQWNFGDGTPVAEGVSVEHRYETPGTYTVTLIARHNNGKVFQDRMIVTVNEPQSDVPKEEEIAPEFKVPNVFTPNADGINDYFTFEIPEGIESFEIHIFNSAGRLVYRSSQPSFQWNGDELDGTESPAGTYFYQIKAVDINHSVYAPKGSITLNR